MEHRHLEFVWMLVWVVDLPARFPWELDIGIFCSEVWWVFIQHDWNYFKLWFLEFWSSNENNMWMFHYLKEFGNKTSTVSSILSFCFVKMDVVVLGPFTCIQTWNKLKPGMRNQTWPKQRPPSILSNLSFVESGHSILSMWRYVIFECNYTHYFFGRIIYLHSTSYLLFLSYQRSLGCNFSSFSCQTGWS